MALENATYVSGLNPANPAQSDPISEGDNHLRLIKSALKATFGSITGAITATHDEINKLAGLVTTKAELGFLSGVTSSIQTQLNSLVAKTRTITAGTGLTGGGDLSADRSLSLSGQALAMHNLASNGIVSRTATDTVAARTITAGTGLTVTNGNGVSGNPVISGNTVSDTVWKNGTDTNEYLVSPAKIAAAIWYRTTPVNTSTVLGATAGANPYDVGTYVIAMPNSSIYSQASGTIVSGSTLKANVIYNGNMAEYDTLPGSWKSMARLDVNVAAAARWSMLYLRVS